MYLLHFTGKKKQQADPRQNFFPRHWLTCMWKASQMVWMVRHPSHPPVRVSTAEHHGMLLNIITCMPLWEQVILTLLTIQCHGVMDWSPVSSWLQVFIVWCSVAVWFLLKAVGFLSVYFSKNDLLSPNLTFCLDSWVAVLSYITHKYKTAQTNIIKQ
jgi:hypothetical protein